MYYPPDIQAKADCACTLHFWLKNIKGKWTCIAVHTPTKPSLSDLHDPVLVKMRIYANKWFFNLPFCVRLKTPPDSTCYMTVLPGKSQENLPNPLAAHFYSAEGVAGFSCLSLSQLWASRRCCKLAPSQSEWKIPFTPMTMKLAS